MSRRSWLILIVVAVLVIAALAWRAGGPGRPVRTEPARAGAIEAWVEERGRTRLPRTEVVAMPVTARVRPIMLREGDAVSAGGIVARVETDDLETAVASAAARLRHLEASITEAADTRVEATTLAELDFLLAAIDRDVEAGAARLATTAAELAFREHELERVREAAASGAARPRELEQAEVAATDARVAHRTAQLALERTRSEYAAEGARADRVREEIEKKELRVAVLREQLAEAQAALEQARRDLGRVEIASPVDGVVLVRHETSGRMLAAGTPLLELGRLEDLEVVVDVLTQDAVRVAPGDPVRLTVPGLLEAGDGDAPAVLGTVRRLEPRGFTKISSLGVEQQRVNVVIDIDPASLAAFRETGYDLEVGYRVRVRIVVDRAEDAVIVPRTALFRGPEDGWRLFVVEAGRVAERAVILGLGNDDEVAVLAGVAAGEPVVVAPDADLSARERVRTDG